MSAERPAYDPPRQQHDNPQEYNVALEKKLVEYAELYQRLGDVLSDADAARQEAEARACALEVELGQARVAIASLTEGLTQAEMRLEAGEREREVLTRELAETRSRLNQLEEAAKADALGADGQKAIMLHEQVELSTSLAETRARLQTVEAALDEERADKAALRQKHERKRRMLVAGIVAALGAGLSFGWVLARLLTR